MNINEAEFKSVSKSELAEFLGINISTLRLRFEAMEEDRVIQGGWRKLKVLTPGLVKSYVLYFGEPANVKVLVKS